MKTFLMYYDRFENATSSEALMVAGEKHIILCHDNSEKFKNVHGELIQTNEPKGIQNNFNHGLSMLEDGEWGVFMSDDYKASKKMVDGKFVECTLTDVFKELKAILPICDKAGIKMVGFSSTGNAFYSKKKFSKYGLVDGRLFAIKKTDFRFHDKINCIPDYYATIFHLKKYGGNLILNQIYADFERYKDGGLGSENERLEEKKMNITILKNTFPNNVIIADKLNQPKGSHVKIKR
jgi:hypothetical protein